MSSVPFYLDKTTGLIVTSGVRVEVTYPFGTTVVKEQVCLPRWHSVKESAWQFRRHKRCWFDPWVGKIPLEKEMATHSSILAWRILGTEELGRLQSMASQRIATRNNIMSSPPSFPIDCLDMRSSKALEKDRVSRRKEYGFLNHLVEYQLPNWHLVNCMIVL